MSAKEVLFSPIGRGRFYASRKNSPRGERTKTMDKIKLSESYRWYKYAGEADHNVPENTENEVPAGGEPE